MQHRGEGNKSARETGTSDLHLSLLASNRPYFTFHFNPLSSVRNSPRCSFGSAARSLQVKKFTNHENLEYDCKGRDNEGGPKYNPSDKFSFTQRLGARFSKAQRFAPTLSYEHYFRHDKEIDINQADLTRRSKSPRAIGTLAHRFPDQKQYKQTPGPQYLVVDNPRFVRKPRYSLYARRFLEHTNPLLNKVSTPRQIGPGSYYVQKCSKDSTDINKPAFTIGNEKRVLFKQRKQSVNQTYDCTPSMGMQPRSGQQRFPGYSIGRRDRDMKEGIFESHMDRIPKKEKFSKPKV